jgi:hypothetical protein
LGLTELAAVTQGIVARADESIPETDGPPVHRPNDAQDTRTDHWWRRGHSMSPSEANMWMNEVLGELCNANDG